MPLSNSFIVKYIYVTPVIRQKGVCYIRSIAGIDVFFVENAKMAIAVKLKSSIKEP